MHFFTKSLVKLLTDVPRRVKMSDEDYHERRGFIYGTIVGSGRECKCWYRDYCPFYRTNKVNWPLLYTRWMESGKEEWPCFDKPGKLEFLRDGIIMETLDMPNMYAEGTGIEVPV